ncbi:hypothetical protein HOK00_00205 [bacterium]|jgi:hypothetical protein|nr:hypothetical protein [bacterium]
MNNYNFNNKKILFFGIGFYDYDEHIKQKLEELGAQVTYMSQYPNLSKTEYIKKKIIKDYEIKILTNYYEKIINNLDSGYDYVFVIKGEFIPLWFMKELKDKLKKTTFILYQWDSIKRLNNYFELSNYFDRILTFDRLDALRYNITFRPLFFKDLYLNKNITSSIKKYDIYFSGYLHSDRYSLIQKIYNYNLNLHLYIRKLEFIKLQVLNIIKFKKIFDSRLVSYSSINDEKNKNNMISSIAVLDIHHPDQSGLTIRTIESIATGNKVITTNKDIVNYEFYNKSNIFIVDRGNMIIDKDFFNIPMIKYENINYYSLDSWVKDIFEL